MFGWLKRKKADVLSDASGSEVSPRTFLNGAYRLHHSDDVEKYTALAVEAFPEFAQRITCFGSSWLGCQFALDEDRIVNGERQVLLLEPGTGEALIIPCGYDTFHSGELVEHPDAIAAINFFQDWLTDGGQRPTYGQCIGYKKPLYLGGLDNITNLELIDFEVYWSVSAQILHQVRGLPIGTRVGNVSIGE